MEGEEEEEEKEEEAQDVMAMLRSFSLGISLFFLLLPFCEKGRQLLH